MPVPVIDLFAGPGGLGEGFASLQGHKRQPFFEIALSIEKDAVAHRTLTLRAVFRRLRGSKDVKHYYSYIRGEIDEAAFRRIPAVASAFEHAATEARRLELGKSDEASIDREIRAALKGQETSTTTGGAFISRGYRRPKKPAARSAKTADFDGPVRLPGRL